MQGTIDLTECYYDAETDLYHRVYRQPDGSMQEETDQVYITKIKENASVMIVDADSSRCTLTFALADERLAGAEQLRFALWSEKQDGVFVLPMERQSKQQFRVDLNVLRPHIVYGKNKVFRACVEAVTDGEYGLYRLEDPSIEQLPQLQKQFLSKRATVAGPLMGAVELENTALSNNEKESNTGRKCGMFYFFTTGYKMSFVLGADNMRTAAITGCELRKIRFQKSRLQIQLEMDQTDRTLAGVRLHYRCKREEDAKDYPFVYTVENRKDTIWIRAELELKDLEMASIYWDLQVLLQAEGEADACVLRAKVKQFKEKFKSFFYNDGYTWKDRGMFLYPYATIANTLSFQYREKSTYDTMAFRFKERAAAAVYKLFKPFWKAKNIYLVYEKFCFMAQDNGYFFFKYCMEHDVEKELNGKILYVIDKKSPDRDKLLPYKKNLISFMSFRYIIYMLAAKLFISTDTRDHAYAWRQRNSLLLGYVRKKKLVFLQHGVTAMKRVDFLYGKGKIGSCELFVVTSDYERDIVHKNFGYTMDEIAVTGFARWDVLEDKSAGSREILMMPTWRNWLEERSDEEFKQSDYYKNYMEFLNSDRLQRILEQYNLKFNFYIHPKFKDYIKDFQIGESDQIRLIPFGEEPLNELMMTCRMLITDYSSVSWDVYYMNKPVLFYQFDLETYEEAHGSYMDMEKELFGDRVMNVEQLFDYIEEYVKRDFVPREQYTKLRPNYYKYVDNDNSKRIVEHIKKMDLD